jgi:hypothetical protein
MTMHTAICTFEDRTLAEQAVERLTQAGFARHAVHLEQRHADGSPMGEPRPGEHDRDVVGKFSFFERLFGAGKHTPHVDAYSRAVERGLYVVLVESPDEAEASRAQEVLHGLNPGDFNVVHRAGERPLAEVIAERESGSLEQRFGTARADMAPSHNRDLRDEGEPVADERIREPERAMASQGWGEQRKLEVVDDDKPIASPDLRPPEAGDKPR